MRARLVTIVAAAVVLAVSVAAPAGATYPGANGKIAFTSRTDGKPQVWTMSESGGQRTRLTGPARPNFNPGFSANGRRIAFISTLDDGVQQIFMMSDEGRNRTQITDGTRNFGDPSISPDGKWIVASAWLGANPKNLWLVKVETGAEKRFTNANGNDLTPSFSPDGSRIIWTRFRTDGTSDIFVKKVDGNSSKQLTDGRGDGKGPSFSPDGTQIVFTHVVGTKNTGKLWIMNADGTGRSKRTDNPTGTMFDHAIWSPDGNRIAFIRQQDATHTVPEIFSIKVSGGGGLTNLTEGRFEPIDLDWGVG